MTLGDMQSIQDIEQKQAEEHWIKKAQHASSKTLFGQDRDRSDQETVAWKCEMDQGLQKLLNDVSKGKPFNVFKLGLAALVITLKGYSRDEKLVGLPMVHYGGEAHIGPIYISNITEEGATARDLLRSLHVQLLEGLEFGNYDLEAFHQRCDRMLESGSQVFEQFLFLMPDDVHLLPSQRKSALEVILLPTGVMLRGGEASYPQAFLEALAENFLWVLKGLLTDLDSDLVSITPPRPEERDRILKTFNNNDVELPEITILQVFEQAAKRFPERAAVICSGRSLDYQSLNAKANGLTSLISETAKGKKLHRVAVLVERNENFPVAVLAVLKAGAAYVPLDPSLPEARIMDCLDIASCDLVVTHIETFGSMIAGLGIPMVDVTSASEFADSPSVDQSASDPAYLILTSGSTGKPKAVSVNHRSLVNHTQWFVREFGLTEQDSSLLMTSVGFDGTLTTFWSTLTTGGALHIYPEKVFDPERIAQYISEQRITYLKVVPTAFRAVLQSEFYQQGADFSSLRFVKMGGEAFDLECAELLWKRFPSTLLANHYGLTEGGIGTSIRLVTPESFDHFKKRLDIGFPYHNNKAYVVNENDCLLPIGAAGQLLIAGPSLADGYVGNSELNKERFFKHPLFGRCFRTYDGARWLTDGSLEFLGRTDRQVKLNGNRIELAEIESHLQHLTLVQNARVEVRSIAGNQALVGYWVGGEDPGQEFFQNHLRERLPAYMIPPYFVRLTSFPVNANGKLDGKALPIPQLETLDSGVTEDSEIGSIGALRKAWEKVLHVRPIHVDQDYFSLGGDSIKAIRVVSEMRQHGYRIQVKDLFDHPTIRELAEKAVPTASMTAQGPVVGGAELSPIQQSFFDKQLIDQHHWNQSVMLFSRDRFDVSKLQAALRFVVDHHDALRMIFSLEEGSIVQTNQPVGAPGVFLLDEVDVLDTVNLEATIAEAANEFQASLDPNSGRTIGARIYHAPAGDHVQLIIHHLVIDAVSFRIFIEDLWRVYRELLADGEPQLPQKTTSFQEWTNSLSKLEPEGIWASDLDYWNQLPDPSEALFFENLLIKNELQESVRSAIRFSFSPERTHQFLTEANDAYGTRPYELALSAWVLAWSRWTGNEHALLRMESHGRYSWNDQIDVSRTIGWFTSEHSLLLACPGEGIGNIVKAVKEEVRRVPNQGLGFGVWKKRGLGTGPIFAVQPEVSFNFLGDLDLSMDEAGLQRSPFSSGQNTSPQDRQSFLLDLNMWTEGEHLWVKIDHQLPTSWNERLEKLQSLFEAAFAEVIEHNLGREQDEKTASDFSHTELEQTDLDQIFQQLEKD